jgi:hypothetical protein
MIVKFIGNRINDHFDGALFLPEGNCAGAKNSNALSIFCGLNIY